MYEEKSCLECLERLEYLQELKYRAKFDSVEYLVVDYEICSLIGLFKDKGNPVVEFWKKCLFVVVGGYQGIDTTFQLSEVDRAALINAGAACKIIEFINEYEEDVEDE